MYQPLLIEELTLDRYVVLAVAGEVDLASVNELQEALDRAARAQPKEVWIDLTEVEFIDSTGLTALVVAHRLLDVPIRRISLICPAGPVRRVLEVAGIDRVIPVHANREDALIFS
jgi:anti-sigma B factor antagonist